MLNKEFPKPHRGLVAERAKAVFLFGPFRLDAGERVLLREGEPVALTPRAFDTLLVLVSHGGRLVEKDRLLEEVWHDTFVEEKTLAQNVLTIRRALGKTPSGLDYIETVPKHGYRFAAPVRMLPPEVAAGGFTTETHSRTELIVEEEFEVENSADPSSAAQGYDAARFDLSADAAHARAAAENPTHDAQTPTPYAVRPTSYAVPASQRTTGRKLTRRRLAVVAAAALGVCVLIALAAALVLRQGWRGAGEPFREFEITKLTVRSGIT